MKPHKPTRARPNPTSGFCCVRGCRETYEGKAKKNLHRCKRHKAELRGFQAQVKDKAMLRLITIAQKRNRPLSPEAP